MRNDERGKKKGIDVAAASIAGCAGADADCPRASPEQESDLRKAEMRRAPVLSGQREICSMVISITDKCIRSALN